MKLFEMYKILGEIGQLESYTGYDCVTDEDFEQDEGFQAFKKTQFEAIFNGTDDNISYLHNNTGTYGNAYMHAFLIKEKNTGKYGIASLEKEKIVPIQYDEIKLVAEYGDKNENYADFIICKNNDGLKLKSEVIPLYDLYARDGKLIIDKCLNIRIADTEERWGYQYVESEPERVIVPGRKHKRVKRLFLTKLYDFKKSKLCENFKKESFDELQKTLLSKDNLTIEEQMVYAHTESVALDMADYEAPVNLLLDIEKIKFDNDELKSVKNNYPAFFSDRDWTDAYEEVKPDYGEDKLSEIKRFKQEITVINELVKMCLYEAAYSYAARFIIKIAQIYISEKLGVDEDMGLVGQIEYFIKNNYSDIAGNLLSLNSYCLTIEEYGKDDIEYLYYIANTLYDMLVNEFGSIE